MLSSPPLLQNVRSVWVHDIWIDTTLSRSDPNYFIHVPTLVSINSSFANDPYTVSQTQPYIDGAYASYSVSGFNCSHMLAYLTSDFDLRRVAMTNNEQPNLGATLFAKSIFDAAVKQVQNAGLDSITVDFSLFNIGSLRLDDVIVRGSLLSEYDVLRICPFLNVVQVVSVVGSFLPQIFNVAAGLKDGPGTSASQYLIYWGVSRVNRSDGSGLEWSIGGKTLDPLRNYTMAITDYLIGGPAPYPTLNVAKSPASLRFLYQSRAGDPFADPRYFFMRTLGAMWPTNSSTTSGGNGGGSSTGEDHTMYVSFTLQFPSLSFNAAVSSQLLLDLSVALQLRQSRLRIVQVAMQPLDVYASSIFLEISPAVAPDPLSAPQASSLLVEQINSASRSTAIFQGVYTKLVLQGSARETTDSTPPTPGEPELNQANQNTHPSIGSAILLLLLLAIIMSASN